MKHDNLFRFEVFATSKQLGDALAALSGRVAQVTAPQFFRFEVFATSSLCSRSQFENISTISPLEIGFTPFALRLALTTNKG